MALPYRKWVSTHLVSEAEGGGVLIGDILPIVTIRAITASINEGDTGIFRVTKSGITAEDITVGISISEQGDAVLDTHKFPTEIVIPARTLSVNIEIPTVDDEVDETTAIITAALQSGVGYELGAPSSARISVADDDLPLPVVQVVAVAQSVAEGENAGFRIRSNRAVTSDLTVHFEIADVGGYAATADKGAKFAVIKANSQEVIYNVPTVEDTEDEDNGSVSLTIASRATYTIGNASSSSVTVTDDDLPDPTVSISRSAASVTEGTAAEFLIRANRTLGEAIRVNYKVAESGNYVAAGDLGDKSAVIPIGASQVAISIPTIGDDTDEANGSVTVTLAAGNGYTLSATQTSTVTVRDDDLPPPTASIVRFSTSVDEGNFAQFIVRLSRAAPTNITVNLRVTQSGAYVDGQDLGDDTVLIRAGSSQVAYNVGTINDTADEDNGSVTVTLLAGGGYVLGSSGTSTSVTIRDNDLPPPTISISRANSKVTEGSPAQFTVRSNRTLDSDLNVFLNVVQVGAFVAAGNLGHKHVTIKANTSSIQYSVPTIDDTTDEPDGSVTVSIRSGVSSNYMVSGSADSSIIVIGDNDEAPRPANVRGLTQGGSDDWHVFTNQPAFDPTLSSSDKEDLFDNRNQNSWPNDPGNPYKTYEGRLWAFAGLRRWPKSGAQGQTIDLAGFSEIVGSYGAASINPQGRYSKLLLVYDVVTFKTYAVNFISSYTTFTRSDRTSIRNLGSIRYQEVWLNGATGTESGTPVLMTKRGTQVYKSLFNAPTVQLYGRVRANVIARLADPRRRNGDLFNTILKDAFAYNGYMWLCFAGGAVIGFEIATGDVASNRSFQWTVNPGQRTYFMRVDQEKLMAIRPNTSTVYFYPLSSFNPSSASTMETIMQNVTPNEYLMQNPTAGAPQAPALYVPTPEIKNGIPQRRYSHLGMLFNEEGTSEGSANDGWYYFDEENTLDYRKVDLLKENSGVPFWRTRPAGSQKNIFAQGATFATAKTRVESAGEAGALAPSAVGTGAGIENREAEDQFPMKTGHPILQPRFYRGIEGAAQITSPAHDYPKQELI